MSDEQLLLFLMQVLVVLGLARLLGELFRRFDQPPLAGEILAGLILGKTVLGSLAPGVFETLFPADALQLALFDVTAQIGILFLLLVIGLEVDVASAWKMRRQSLLLAVTGVVVPLALGSTMAWFFYDTWAEVATPRPAFALFIGAAVSITAITVVARLLFDLRILKSDLGLLLLSAMAINDLLGWVVLAVVLGMLGSDSTGPAGAALDAVRIAGVLTGTVLFSGIATTIGRAGTTRVLRWFEAKSLPSPATPLSFVVCLGLACGIAIHAIGVHPIFGFLIAGVMAGDRNALSEHTRSVIAQMVESIFVPLFFAGICLHVDFTAEFDVAVVFWVALLSIGGKFFGAWLGTLIVDIPRFDRLPAAIAHIPGGSMGVLLAVVAEHEGVIGKEMFVAIIFASIASSLIVGPALAWSLRRRGAPNVLGFFSRQGLVPELQARTRFEAIDELVDCAIEVDGSLSRDWVREAVHAREETMGTGVGEGIAIPHARLEGLQRPSVFFGLSKEGIAWDAIDGRPAQLVFLVLTPADEGDAQLEILSSIARGIDAEQVAALLRCGSEGEIWSRLQSALTKDG
jgi:K+:H+ antiporter